MSEIRLTQLENGLRVITDTVESVASVALGAWVGVGTRNEDMKDNGVAHLTEHMLFKGTEKRNAQEIAEIIENVGGHVNAYTSREVTSYHVHLLKQDTPLALDFLSDIVQHSTLPEHELDRERHVVLQEIGMCHDTPDDIIFDNYYETAYPGQALGAPILGRPDIIESMSRDTISEYVQHFYSPSRMVISAAGNVQHDNFVAEVEDMFAHLPNDNKHEKKPADYQGGDNRTEKELEQSHVILGFQGVSRLSEQYYTVQALSILLGGGMSSRLFQEIREKRGLVYSIFSFHSGYQDDGQFGIYAGTGPNDLEELVPVTCDELLKTTAEITEYEVERTKAQMKASLLMGRENMMSRADQQAKFTIFQDKILDTTEITKKIEAITANDIQDAAKQIFATTPTLTALGPLSKLESYDKIQSRLAA